MILPQEMRGFTLADAFTYIALQDKPWEWEVFKYKHIAPLRGPNIVNMMLIIKIREDLQVRCNPQGIEVSDLNAADWNICRQEWSLHIQTVFRNGRVFLK